MGKRIKRAIVKTARRAVDAVTTLLMDRPAIDNATNPAPTPETVAADPGSRNRGRFTNRRVVDYQNWVFECNATDHQTDDVIAANFTREHPMSSVVVAHGGSFPVRYITNMRTQYNRGRHSNVAPTVALARYDKHGEPMAGRAPKTV